MKQDGSPSTNHWNDKFDRMKEKNMGKKKLKPLMRLRDL